MDSHSFDLWADTYDDSVRLAEKANEYPFAGYTGVMNAIYTTVMQSAPAKVLDVGLGTALLSRKLYDAGCGITGIDFSAGMIASACEMMPGADLLQWDFAWGIPPALRERRFDFVISTYALHHLAEDSQAAFIRGLCALLSPRGRLLIGDVCFPTPEALAACREKSGELWDDEEHYLVFSQLRERLPGFTASFLGISFCGGVMEIVRRP